MYDEGEGVPKDKVQAYKWFSLAATNGDRPTAMLCDSLEKEVTPAQVTEAKKLANEWKSKRP